MPRYPDPKSMLGPQTRRDFLKRLIGAAASAAVPKLPEVPAAKAVEAVSPYVTDPETLKAFRGIRSFAIRPGDPERAWNQFEFDDYRDAESFASGADLRKYLQSLRLDDALRTATPAKFDPDVESNIGHFEWNTKTGQWHPVVALRKEGGDPRLGYKTEWKYLHPGHQPPENTLDWDYWSDIHAGIPESQAFISSDEFANQMLTDWRRHKVWEMGEKGPDSKELGEDPELRNQYLRSMSIQGRAPGGRFDPLSGLTASREVELPIDQPRQPVMSKFRKAAAAAPFLAVPLLAPREEE